MSDTLSLRALEVNHPALAADAAIRRVAALEAEIAALRASLAELHALVNGECPALLDETRGGCSRLAMDIIALLAKDAP